MALYVRTNHDIGTERRWDGGVPARRVAGDRLPAPSVPDRRFEGPQAQLTRRVAPGIGTLIANLIAIEAKDKEANG